MTTLYILMICIALMAGWWGGYAFGWRMRGEQEAINAENAKRYEKRQEAVDPLSPEVIVANWDALEEAMQRHPAGKRKHLSPPLRLVDGE